MSIEKKFNEWVSKNFKGLSVATLTQFLNMNETMPLFKYLNMESVHVDLFNYFKGVHNDKNTDTFEMIKHLVDNCEWL